MERALCAEVRAALIQAAQSNHSTIPTKLVTHIAECALCRGALMLLLFESLGAEATIIDSDCAKCQDLLAGFLDLEADEGSRVALRVYPHVAAHFWTCVDCTELYQLTKAALDAERLGMLEPIQSILKPKQPQRLARFTLSRAFLHAALPTPPAAFGARRNAGEGPSILFETLSDGYRISFAVESQQDGNWTIIVRVLPVVEGWLALVLDEQQYRARVHHGIATLSDIPSSALAASTGPDLISTIELDDPFS